VDWGTGEYEHTAAQLQPAAEVTVGHLAAGPAERVVDLGCGTGNASLLVAASGADVLGVDPAARLLDVARARAAEAGASARFAPGEAAAIPAEEGSVDAVVSVFGLIFAPDAEAAAAEIGRVLAPAGRLVYSAWQPTGGIAAATGVGRAAMAELTGASGPPPFPWQDPRRVEALLGPLGFRIEVHDHRLAFEAASPAAFAEDQMAHHPMWLEARALLEPAGRWDGIEPKVLAALETANEDPSAFRVTSDYVVVVARR
jgi:SAM-dependent methyltransferase